MVPDGRTKGSWLHKLALGGLVVVPTALFLIWAVAYSRPREPEVSREVAVEAPAANYQPGGAECRPEARRKTDGTKEGPAIADRCAAHAEEYRQQQETLRLAARAADYAERQTIIAQGQAKSAFVQTIATILAFGAAGMAALYARGAVTEGRRSADAAHDALKDAREGADQQTKRFTQQLAVAQASADAAAKAARVTEQALLGLDRPLLYVEIVAPGSGLYDTPAFRSPSWRIWNYGRTPATIVSSFCTLSVVPWAGQPEILRPTEIEPVGVRGDVIAPGKFKLIDRMSANAQDGETFASIYAPSKSTFVFGFIGYEDAIGRQYMHVFTFHRWARDGEVQFFRHMPNLRPGEEPFNYDKRLK